MWMKLGTVLVREGIITAEQLNEALAVQKKRGGRLGTILVDLNAISMETLGTWLGRISGFPSATREMILAAPQELLELVPRDLAERLECLPFRCDDGSLHLAVVNPYNAALVDALAARTKLPLLRYVVPEGLFQQMRDARYGPARKSAPPPPRTTPPAPRSRVEPAPERPGATTPIPLARPTTPPSRPPRLQPAPAMPFPVVEAPPLQKIISSTPFPIVEAPPFRLPSSAPALPAKAPTPPAPTTPVQRPRPVMVQAPPETPPPFRDPPPGALEDEPTQPNPWPREDSLRPVPHLVHRPPALTVAQTTAALASTRTRDGVVDVLLRYAAGILDTALLLIVREGMATGWAGRGEGIDDDHVLLVDLPLGAPSLFQEAHDRRHAAGGTVSDNPIHRRFYKALRRAPPASAVVVPVVLRGRVVNLLYADRVSGLDALEAAGPLSEMARQASAAYARILAEQRQQA